jgi:hypothetical protein
MKDGEKVRGAPALYDFIRRRSWWFILFLFVITEPVVPHDFWAKVGRMGAPMILGAFALILSALAAAADAEKPRARPRAPLVVSTPGSYLLELAEISFSPEAIELTFKPIVADWQKEYFTALAQRRPVKARWISARYALKFLAAMALSKLGTLVRRITSVGR